MGILFSQPMTPEKAQQLLKAKLDSYITSRIASTNVDLIDLASCPNPAFHERVLHRNFLMSVFIQFKTALGQQPSEPNPIIERLQDFLHHYNAAKKELMQEKLISETSNKDKPYVKTILKELIQLCQQSNPTVKIVVKDEKKQSLRACILNYLEAKRETQPSKRAKAELDHQVPELALSKDLLDQLATQQLTPAVEAELASVAESKALEFKRKVR